MLAGDHAAHAPAVVEAILDKIMVWSLHLLSECSNSSSSLSDSQAAPDNSLHFVYLFDSILKNIGGAYVSAIEARVNRMFLKVFQTVGAESCLL